MRCNVTLPPAKAYFSTQVVYGHMMYKAILIISLKTIYLFEAFSQYIPKPEHKYSQNLEYVISKTINSQSIRLKRVEKCIPANNAQFRIYYSYTYPANSNEKEIAFNKLDSLIYNNAELNRLNFVRKIVLMAEFVDGEYAEAYYDYLENIVRKNEITFCKTYQKLSGRTKNRLVGLYLQHCEKEI